MDYCEEVNLARYRVQFLADRCVGCGNCQEVCTDNWELKDGISHPLQVELDEVSCNQDAAEECPESCIEILEI